MTWSLSATIKDTDTSGLNTGNVQSADEVNQDHLNAAIAAAEELSAIFGEANITISGNGEDSLSIALVRVTSESSAAPVSDTGAPAATVSNEAPQSAAPSDVESTTVTTETVTTETPSESTNAGDVAVAADTNPPAVDATTAPAVATPAESVTAPSDESAAPDTSAPSTDTGA